LNLINNAVEAMSRTTNANRTLRVRTEVRGRDEIAVSVQDAGPGIDSRQLDEVFNAFVSTKAHGTGLGLAICRMIVERHGGQITASSDGKSGALFQFVLPIGSTDKVRSASNPTDSRILIAAAKNEHEVHPPGRDSCFDRLCCQPTLTPVRSRGGPAVGRHECITRGRISVHLARRGHGAHDFSSPGSPDSRAARRHRIRCCSSTGLRR
jgi:hypothetical protein